MKVFRNLRMPFARRLKLPKRLRRAIDLARRHASLTPLLFLCPLTFVVMFSSLSSPINPLNQPNAIAKLTEFVLAGSKHQTLVGVTGSGKTFTVANVIKNVDKPTLVISHNKTLAAQLYAEFRTFHGTRSSISSASSIITSLRLTFRARTRSSKKTRA